MPAPKSPSMKISKLDDNHEGSFVIEISCTSPKTTQLQWVNDMLNSELKFENVNLVNQILEPLTLTVSPVNSTSSEEKLSNQSSPKKSLKRSSK